MTVAPDRSRCRPRSGAYLSTAIRRLSQRARSPSAFDVALLTPMRSVVAATITNGLGRRSQASIAPVPAPVEGLRIGDQARRAYALSARGSVTDELDAGSSSIRRHGDLLELPECWSRADPRSHALAQALREIRMRQLALDRYIAEQERDQSPWPDVTRDQLEPQADRDHMRGRRSSSLPFCDVSRSAPARPPLSRAAPWSQTRRSVICASSTRAFQEGRHDGECSIGPSVQFVRHATSAHRSVARDFIAAFAGLRPPLAGSNARLENVDPSRSSKSLLRQPHRIHVSK